MRSVLDASDSDRSVRSSSTTHEKAGRWGGPLVVSTVLATPDLAHFNSFPRTIDRFLLSLPSTLSPASTPSPAGATHRGGSGASRRASIHQTPTPLVAHRNATGLRVAVGGAPYAHRRGCRAIGIFHELGRGPGVAEAGIDRERQLFRCLSHVLQKPTRR